MFERIYRNQHRGRVDRTVLTTALVLLTSYLGLRWAGILPKPYSDYRTLVLLSYVPAFLVAAAVVVIVNGNRRDPHIIRNALAQANLFTAASFISVLIIEAFVARGYWVIPTLTAGIWLLLHLSIRFGSAAVTVSIIGVQTVIALASAPLLSRIQASNYAVDIGTVALVIPICILLYLRNVEQQREALEIASIRQSRFIAHVGHDLGQPLNATRLLVAALNETSLTVEQRLIVARIGQSVDETSGLFRSILDISMLDSNSVSARADRIEIGAFLIGLAIDNADAAKRAGVLLRVIRSSRTIRSDHALLGTMVQNLLSNAICHAPGSRVLLGARVRNGLLSIEVHDDGPGISSDAMPHVFDEFYRRSPNSLGAGLGLSIVQRLAGILGARVTLGSRLGKGTSASIAGLKIETH